MRRVPFLLAAGACLLVAGLAGLQLSGWSIPVPRTPEVLHAPLMFGGFFGTLIALERAVGLGSGWAWLAPLLSATGGLVMALGGEPLRQSGSGLMLAGSLVFTAAAVRVAALSAGALHAGVMLLGAACLPAGHLVLLAGGAVAAAVPFWMSFLILTIAGERLELSRVLGPDLAARRRLLAAAILPAAGALLGLRWHHTGEAVTGAGMLLVAIWYADADLAKRNLGRPGLPRYSAVAILAGYAWLGLAGACGVLDAFMFHALLRDAFLHGAMLGFVFSMVMGHAPIIIPSVLGKPVAWRPVAWWPLGMLHVSVLARFAADVFERSDGRMAAAALNGVAIATFAAVMVHSVAAEPAA